MAAEFWELGVGDTSALQSLLESNPEYTRRISGRDPFPSDALTILTALPPGISISSKHVWGMWEDGHLLAFADVIRGFSHPSAAHIGLLISAGDIQRRGLGRKMHAYVLDRVRQWSEISVVRLGIVQTNADVAKPFWQSCGYTETGEVTTYTDGDVHSLVALWEREVPGTPPQPSMPGSVRRPISI